MRIKCSQPNALTKSLVFRDQQGQILAHLVSDAKRLFSSDRAGVIAFMSWANEAIITTIEHQIGTLTSPEISLIGKNVKKFAGKK